MGTAAPPSSPQQPATPLKEDSLNVTDNSNNSKVVVKKKNNYKVDWLKVETDYLTKGLSYRELAKKYDVSYQMVGQKGAKLGWAEKKAKLSGAISEKIGQGLDRVATAVAENVTQTAIDLITQTKTKHIKESQELIKMGMKSLKKHHKDGTLKDSTALEAIKHGHDTIHELEGMKKIIPSTVIILTPEQREQRKVTILEEIKQMESSGEAIEGEIVG